MDSWKAWCGGRWQQKQTVMKGEQMQLFRKFYTRTLHTPALQVHGLMNQAGLHPMLLVDSMEFTSYTSPCNFGLGFTCPGHATQNLHT